MRIAIGGVFLVSGLISPRAAPIAPSQVTPVSLAAPKLASPSVPVIGDSLGVSAPRGAQALSLAIGRVRLAGGFPELAEANAALAKRLEGKHVSVAAIYEAAAALERAYARAGFVLVRIAVPPQRLVDRGPLQIVVVDGYIESVNDEAVAPSARASVRARLTGLIGQRHVSIGQIERALLIAGDLPGLKFKSAISRGKSAGGAILIVEGEQHSVGLTVSTDNSLPAGLGGWESFSNFTLDNTLGFGEQAYFTLGASRGPNLDSLSRPPMRVVGGGLVAPIGVDGMTLTPEYTNTTTRPAPVPGAPATVGQFNRLAFRLSDPLIRDRSQTLTLEAAIEFIDQRLEAPQFGTDINRDRYAAARIGLSWQGLVLSGLPFQLHAQISRGLVGRNADDAFASGVPLSRIGTTPHFLKANVQSHLTMPLPLDARLDLIAKAQTTFGRPIFSSEQFALDGADAISTFSSGALSVDAGATGRAEFARTFACDGMFPMTLSPYLFGALGWGHVVVASATEQSTLGVGAFGSGLRASLDTKRFPGATFGVEVSQQYSNRNGQRSGNRLNFSLGLQF